MSICRLHNIIPDIIQLTTFNGHELEAVEHDNGTFDILE